MLYERWRQIARTFPNEPALRDFTSNKQWTFSELVAEIENSAPEKTPVVQFPKGNSSEFIFSVLRAWRTGSVICPLELDQVPPNIPAPLPAGIVHLKTTSATTGAPRLIAFTGEQLMADAGNIVATMGLSREWPNVGVISLAHSYGFSNLVLPLLLHGIPLILGGAPLPETIRRVAATEKAITLAAVPALWRTWHEANVIPSNVAIAISAGAPLPLVLEQNIFAMRGLKIHNFYGASECGGIAYDASATPRRDASVAGTPMRNVDLSVTENGCLEVRSRAVGQTYWPEPGANLRDGIFRTSDLAEISYGMVYLRGRSNDQINVAGRKISPEAIERVLLAHPAVRDCIVFGAQSRDLDRGENVVACVVTKANTTVENLRQFLLEKMPAWQVPREWKFVDSLEVNQRGKLSRTEWRAKYLSE
jgi:long-chain acyl-CoA synthetase